MGRQADLAMINSLDEAVRAHHARHKYHVWSAHVGWVVASARLDQQEGNRLGSRMPERDAFTIHNSGPAIAVLSKAAFCEEEELVVTEVPVLEGTSSGEKVDEELR